ncbi:hypothetical protein [Nitrososphaeria virus YSH_462411]|uniref:Uncharacterized protein n=1 Tax=Nitrososphaeria virus YSH_462411 TaxID=3071321 RepID=A0A976UAJ0_9CAUD|nr:hypothetical protein QKV92_gp67 [Yangshan Harbor Nitrososphaeria virus]UVF62339.1 hypothetical protein [Nitrososphaeria virus YSH_462411]
MTKLEKKEGNVEQCPTCTQKITCRMTKGSDKYPAKLQWQNEDGTAHYNFDFKTKETSCKGVDIPITTGVTYRLETITMPKADGVEKEVIARIQKDSKAIAYQKIARYLGVKEACEESNITNPAMIGMLFNAVDKET